MSVELRRLIDRELALIDRLILDHREFIATIMATPPGLIEREAAASMLHSFYTGVESIMRTIAMMSSAGFRKSESWHSELLDAMERGDGLERPLLSRELAGTLKEYLQFRHRFRNLYGFDLEWERMRPLVGRVESTMNEFGAAVRGFVDA